MAETFSAGPQALGYLHQARYALYALLTENREEAAVVIERLDDIEILDQGSPVRLKQLKHHVARERALTNASPELWKTIRIWSTLLKRGLWDPDTTYLNLVTTATAPEGSTPWLLRATPFRDEERGHDLLLTTIRRSRTTDEVMRAAFTSFQELSDVDQRRLVRAITVVDGAPTISDLAACIRQQLRYAAPPAGPFLSRLCEQVEGWWFDKVVAHLVEGSHEAIARAELQRKVWSITERLTDANLPIDYADAVPECAIDPDNDDRIFVQQLRILGVNTRRIYRAVLDYYRAFEQRAKWVRDHLLVDDDIACYESKLIDEWEAFKLVLEDKIPDVSEREEACVTLGREILAWVETTADFRIRPYVDARFITRGSYHILADTETPRVYWHPRFAERLGQILSK
jgi:hypothetical protein